VNSGWSWFVIALVVLNVAGCVVLLLYTSGKQSKGDAQGTGHVWDGDLREYDKPLPRWWINLFYITIVFSIGYVVWFPGMGNLAGTSGWTSRGEHDAETAAANAKLAETFRPYDDKPLAALAQDPVAMQLGRSVFSNNCTTCHGTLAQGAPGYPDLSDDVWQWGGREADVLQTVLRGRKAQMPAWSTTLASMGGSGAVDAVTTYVLSLTDKSLLSTNGESAAVGGKLFAAVCSSCHGTEAKGNVLLGAPDLTDGYWLYGRSRSAIRDGLKLGRNGIMPAHEPLIGETRARLAAAYVWSLTHKAGP
jgi:cytochrome c oxidase cbb3-type subunit 3